MSKKVSRRQFLSQSAGVVSYAAMSQAKSVFAQSEKKPPNVVIIFTDDQGYGDVGCFGAEGFETPNLDRMASEGVRFTDFYAAQAVCGASRAALMTGCYPNRIGIQGAPGPGSRIGINDNEWTIAEVLKQKGYATAIYGKWHLGDDKQFLPMQHGFDDYFGLPYSNDMWPYHPNKRMKLPPLPLIDKNEIVEYNPDQTQLTTWYTEHAVKFIEQNKENPFFLYVPHSMPHVPLFVSDKFKGKTEKGIYGDVIAEIDWSVGKILDSLKQNGLDDNTLVIFTADNGPWLSYGTHAGSAGPLREGKGTAWDGGQREACIMRFPGQIQKNTVCCEPAMTIDLLPTIAKLADAPLPPNKIDGLDIWHLISGEPDAKTPHDALHFYWGNDLHAVRSGDWKLHLPHTYRTMAGRPGGTDGTPTSYSQGRTSWALYNLKDDIGELRNVYDRHPEIASRLKGYADQICADIGCGSKHGPGYRPPGRIK